MRTRILLAAVGLVLVALVAFVADWIVGSISLEQSRGWIDDRLSRALGLDVTIAGELQLDLFPPAFQLGGVTFRRPGDAADVPPIARVERVELDFHPWNLLRGQVEIDELHLLGAAVHLTGELGPAPRIEDIEQIEREGEASVEDPRLRIRRIHVEPLELVYQQSPGTPVTSVRFARFVAQEDSRDGSIELEAHGWVEGSPFDLDARLGTLPELLATTRPFPLEARGSLLGADVSVRGTLASPARLEGIDLVLQARVPSAAVLVRDPRWPVPRTGPLALRTRVADPGGALALLDLSLETLPRDPLQLRVSGSIVNGAELRGAELSLELTTEHGALLEPLLEALLDPWISKPLGVGPVQLSARLSNGGVSGTLRARTADERVSLALEGTDPDLERKGDLALTAELEARDLSTAAELVGLGPVPALGPVAATARLHDRSGTLGADALQASIGTRGAGTWLELSGDVLELADLKGVRLEAEFGVASLRDLQPYATRTLPDVGPLTGAAGLADADGSLGVEHLRVTGGRADVLEIDVRGAFEDVRAWNEIDVRVRASARDLALVGALVDAELPPVGPVEVDVSARGSDELLEWTGRTRLDKTQLEGSWSLQFAPGTRPLLSGIVTSPQIYLDDIGIEPRADREPPLRGTDWLQTPIPFESLRLFDAKLVLDAHQVLGRNGLELSEVDASARLEDGRLSLDAIEVVYESGRVRASGTIDARSAVPSLALRADARRVDLSLLLAQIVERREDAGVLSGELDLRSAGGTPDELLRRLEGTLALELREASLASRYARRFVSNLVSVSMPRLSFRSAPTVGCATLRIVADAGVARVEELRIDAPKASILGEGTIDLGEKRYDLLLVPQPRDPGLVSVAVTVQVTGPLDDPQFRPVPLSLGTSLARGLYANAKRPLGAAMRPVETVTQPLGAVWNRLRGTAPESAAPHPCDREDAAAAAP